MVAVVGCSGPEDLHCPLSCCLPALSAYRAGFASQKWESFHTFLNYFVSQTLGYKVQMALGV